MSAVEFKLLSSVRLDFPEEGEEGNTISFPQEGHFYFAQEGEKVPGGESHIITMFGISCLIPIVQSQIFSEGPMERKQITLFQEGGGGGNKGLLKLRISGFIVRGGLLQTGNVGFANVPPLPCPCVGLKMMSTEFWGKEMKLYPGHSGP